MPNHHPIQPEAVVADSVCTKCKDKVGGIPLYGTKKEPKVSVYENGKWIETPASGYVDKLKAGMPATGGKGPVWTGD